MEKERKKQLTIGFAVVAAAIILPVLALVAIAHPSDQPEEDLAVMMRREFKLPPGTRCLTDGIKFAACGYRSSEGEFIMYECAQREGARKCFIATFRQGDCSLPSAQSEERRFESPAPQAQEWTWPSNIETR